MGGEEEPERSSEERLGVSPEYEVPRDGIERMHSSNVRGFSGLALNY